MITNQIQFLGLIEKIPDTYIGKQILNSGFSF